MQYASRISACRRGLSGHEAAKPREHGCPQERGRQQASSERGQAENQTTLLQPSRGEASAAANKNYLEPLCYIEPAHCVGSSGVQSVGGAAAVRAAAFSHGQLRRRLEYAARHGRQRGAGGAWYVPRGVTGPWQAHRQCSSGAALPNHSLKRSANGRPPGPGRWYAVHFHRPGLASCRRRPLSSNVRQRKYAQ